MDKLLISNPFSEERYQWLQERGYTEGDVMEDERGEYVMTQYETDHSDGYRIEDFKLRLPNFEEQEKDLIDLDLSKHQSP